MLNFSKFKFSLISIGILSFVYVILSSNFFNYEDISAESSFFKQNLHEISQTAFVERLEHLNKACAQDWMLNEIRSEKQWNKKDVFDHILVDKKHKLLYCYVPKVACTNWKRVFILLNGGSNLTDALKIPANVAHSRNALFSLSNYTTKEADTFLKYYTKFLFVRHPFERLLSAFKNKLDTNYINSNYFHKRLSRLIIGNTRMKSPNVTLNNTEHISFDEFTAYLTKSPPSMYNEHWKPITSLCEPCRIKYDFIGKYETLYFDSNFLLKKVGVHNIRFPQTNKFSNTYKQLKQYFSSLPALRIKQLYSVYKNDFKLFSYSLVDLLGYEVGL